MIKLKDLLLEGKPPSIFVPRRMEDRVERMIALYVRNGSKGNLSLKVITLENSPKSVGKDFYCYANNLISLTGASEFVGNNFDCSSNYKLTSLEGAPKFVGGNFYCLRNSFTEEQIRAVCDIKGKVYV